MKTSENRKKLENQGFQVDQILIKGLQTGKSIIKVSLNE
jgi:hypothetical protein